MEKNSWIENKNSKIPKTEAGSTTQKYWLFLNRQIIEPQ
jgi:hypothetical protein